MQYTSFFKTYLAPPLYLVFNMSFCLEQKLGNRIIRVNEVRTRGPRDFGRDGFRRDPRRYGRDPYWDRRDREQSYDRERDPYHDRDSDRSREHDRERDYEHGGFNREVDYPMDRDHEVDDIHPREHDRAAETHNMDSDNDKYKEHGSRKRFRCHVNFVFHSGVMLVLETTVAIFNI
jgi:hypothetical protein